MTTRFIGALTVTTIIVLSASSLHAFNEATHRIINIAAARYDRLDSFIRESLGFAAGRDAVLVHHGRKFTVEQWIGEGGEREDDGGPVTGRFYNHFHNPLRPWSEAGLHAIRHNSSSVHWMQDQGAGENWTWKDARQFYLRALTEPSASAREQAAADLFRTLGQIMHLVVDASVPEHTRADPHPFGTIARLFGRQAGNYEYWVSHQQESLGEAGFVARYLSMPIGFDGSILQMPPPPGEHVAPVPIARLVDTDTYTGSDPNLTLSPAIGIAEFANANFFSENTLSGQFPFPRRDSLVPNPRMSPKSSHVRAYLAKPSGQGQPTSVALAECASERVVARWIVNLRPPYPCVDEAVWEETASHMLPRAVGYARGVLDYFFRGALTIASGTRNGIAAAGFINDSGETMEGTFEVYVDGPSEHRQRVQLSNGSLTTLGPGDVGAAVWSVPPGSPSNYVLVFRGRMGMEAGAVVSQTFMPVLVP
jgi:hypothetical protein